MKEGRGIIFFGILIILAGSFAFAGDNFGNIQFSPEEDYDLNGDGTLTSNDYDILINCYETQDISGSCSVIDIDSNEEISFSELLVIQEYFFLNNITPSSDDRPTRRPRGDNSCTDDQTILKLSSSTNAHGAFWNDEDYPIRVCYDEIFGRTYPSTPNPHESNVAIGNKILSLNSEGNAHGSPWKDSVGRILPTAYSNAVNYGDLVCVSRQDDCLEGEEFIVSLSSQTNAHLSASDSYPINICCSSAFAETPDVVLVCNNANVCEIGDNCGCAECLGSGTSASVCGTGLVCNEDSKTCIDLTTPLCDVG